MSDALLASLRTSPLLLARPQRAVHVLGRNVAVYRRRWIFIVSGFFEPFFYLLSIGVGLSRLVGGVAYGGRVIAYTHFVAPGLLASSAMNGAILDTTFNLFYKLKVAKTYDAMLATPVGVGDVALGEVGWALCRGLLYSTSFCVVMAGFGLFGSPWAICCLPTAGLVSLAFASAGSAITSHMRTWQDLSIVSLSVLPMFLFSGTFYPLAIYPHALADLIQVTPLYQGVVLERAFSNGIVTPGLWWHVAYLAAMAAGSVTLVARRFVALLTP